MFSSCVQAVRDKLKSIPSGDKSSTRDYQVEKGEMKLVKSFCAVFILDRQTMVFFLRKGKVNIPLYVCYGCR